jgi:hypothetical protein
MGCWRNKHSFAHPAAVRTDRSRQGDIPETNPKNPKGFRKPLGFGFQKKKPGFNKKVKTGFFLQNPVFSS